MVPQRRRRRRVIQKVGLGAYKLVVSRGPEGFGFTISGEAPCVVSHVSHGSPAERAGLRVGLVLLAVGSSPVTKVAHDVVARLIASAPQAIALTVTTDRGPEASDTSEEENMSQRPRHTQRVRRPLRSEVRNRVEQMYKKKSHVDPHAPLLVSAALKEPCKSHLAHTDVSSLHLKYPGCNPATEVLSPSVLYNLRHQQQVARSEKKLECRAIVGYLGTIETPAQIANGSEHSTVRASIRKLRHAKRSATLVLMTILPLSMNIKISNGTIISEHSRDKIIYVNCNSENDYRYFGIITCRSHNNPDDVCIKTCSKPDISHNCHVFCIDPKLIEHNIHIVTANEFQIKCTLDPVTNHCLEFPTSCEYVVSVIRSMYSLHITNGYTSPGIENLSKLAVKSSSPSTGTNILKNNRPAPLRGVKYGRKVNGCKHDMKRFEFSLNKLDIHNFANSPQPSNHSEFTTTSSNSDSGIGFHNDCQNITDRLLADFGHQARHLINFPNQYEPQVSKKGVKARPLGITDSNFEMDASFLSNTMPVVDGFEGRGQPLNPLDEVILSTCDGQSSFHSSPGKSSDTKLKSEDTYNYNGIHYSNIPPNFKKAVKDCCPHHYENVKDICPHYDPVYTENEGNHYEMIKPEQDMNIESINKKLKAINVFNDRPASGIENTDKVTDFVPDYSQKSSNETESFDNITVISSKSQDYINSGRTSIDSMSIYSSKSQDYCNASTIQLKNLKGSVDDILMYGLGKSEENNVNDDFNFLHPANVKIKSRKKHLKLLSKTKTIFNGKESKKSVKNAEKHARVLSASVDDICGSQGSMENSDVLPTACSEPDLREGCSHNSESEQTSPFRRWTASSGAGSSYRHPDQKMYNKQDSNDVCSKDHCSKGGGVARWSLGLEHLLADKAGAAAFAAFLAKEFAAENIKFWWSCEQYKSVPESSRVSVAREIWSRHLADGAPEPVNVDAPARRAASLNLEQAAPELFCQAQKQIFNLMKFDSYPRFLRSAEHAECARADLRGELCSLTTLTHNILGTSPTGTPTKLKKSASNVSERRRSGGSLLPWSRLRAISRDREPSQDDKTNSNDTNVSQPRVQQSGPISCSLCRVVLPDGATSVVGVEASQCVRAVLDRVLARRACHVTNYDVIVLDSEPSAVDLDAPSSNLGGKLVRIERRCVFRLELPSRRCVAVRCRPNKRLRHVLRHVLRRHIHTRALLVRDRGVLLSPDTRAEEVDGCRLQVSVDESVTHDDTPDDDTQDVHDDTRLCDDDTRDGHDARDKHDARDEHDARDGHDTRDSRDTDQKSISSEGSRSGVVRAALRPGPPLHTHPPEFLENLRQTQRARLQPSPGAPPPLPPKPRHLPTTNMAGGALV